MVFCKLSVTIFKMMAEMRPVLSCKRRNDECSCITKYLKIQDQTSRENSKTYTEAWHSKYKPACWFEVLFFLCLISWLCPNKSVVCLIMLFSANLLRDDSCEMLTGRFTWFVGVDKESYGKRYSRQFVRQVSCWFNWGLCVWWAELKVQERGRRVGGDRSGDCLHIHRTAHTRR